MTFFPKDYSLKKPNEIILHENDNRLDFRPHKLRLGTPSDNTKDAHDNGKYDGTQKERVKCTSYINGVVEKEHNSQMNAVNYLKSIGFEKATCSSICQVLSGKCKTAYGRTWKRV